MQVNEFDNPAKRLLTLLKQAQGMNPDTPCRTAWHTLLKTGNDEATLMVRLGKVMGLPAEIVQSMQRHYPNDPNSWNHWFSRVNNAFVSQQLAGQWQSFSGQIDEHTITYLGMTATLLGHMEHVAPISNDDAKRFKDELAEILADVLTSDLEPKVKDTVGRHLQRLIVAIDEYSLTGALPILDAVDAAIGHIAIDQQYADTLKNTSIGSRFAEALAAVANVVTVVVGLPQLPAGVDAAKKLLGF